MSRWNTQEIVKLCQGVKGVTKVWTDPPGGDYDTTEVVVGFGKKNPEGLSVQGFVDFTLAATDCLDETTIDETDLDNVVLRSWGSDSDGGVQTDDETILIAAARIRKALEAAGFQIWNNWNQLQ